MVKQIYRLSRCITTLGGSAGNWPYVYFDDILEWDQLKGEWKEIGKMSQARRGHGMAVVDSDVSVHCIEN